jgi:hypothetical protein
MCTQEFLIGATLLKEARYRPEREVRIVCIPGTAAMSAIVYPLAFLSANDTRRESRGSGAAPVGSCSCEEGTPGAAI